MKHIINFSGGKDSTALLFMMIEKSMRVDEVIYCNTGLEFPEMERHIKKVKSMIDVPFTELRPEKPFIWWLWEKPVYGGEWHGYGWPTPFKRWCTTRLKLQPMNDYYRNIGEHVRYIGVTSDEQHRTTASANHKFPLIKWNMTGLDCLNYCRSKGFEWEGLYQHYKSVACWCCPLQNTKSLRYLFNSRPELWQRLREIDGQRREGRISYFFPGLFSVADMQARFELEQKYIAEGQSISGRKFFKEWKRIINHE